MFPPQDVPIALFHSNSSYHYSLPPPKLSTGVIFAFFALIESFRGFLLYWIPFYYAFKLAFLLWAFLPATRGAKFLYDSFLKDFLKKKDASGSRIDAAMADAKKVSSTGRMMCLGFTDVMMSQPIPCTPFVR